MLDIDYRELAERAVACGACLEKKHSRSAVPGNRRLYPAGCGGR